MKWSCYLYFLACSITISKAQDTDEGCTTCAVDNFLKAGFEDWILPSAAGVLQFLVPDSSPAPDAIPKEPDKQQTNNNPGIVKDPDIRRNTIVSPVDEKCDGNGDGSTSCAVATAQIIWPLPRPCGDKAQASRILNEINRLAPTGRIQQLMGKNIGIKFIEPDVEMEDGTEISSKSRKRRLNKENMHSQLRVRETGMPDFILVERGAPEHKALISTPPDHLNPNRDFAYFNSAGDRATIYWMDWQLYMSNPDLRHYRMAENRLTAEGLSEEWARPNRDHGGCMLSIIGGLRHGLLKHNVERSDRVQLKMVKVMSTVSSFLSGIGAIITDLELRTERNERVSTWTVIGTHLLVEGRQFGRMLQLESAILFQILTIQYQAIVVVGIGARGVVSEPADVWPANIARASGIPIIVAASALYYIHPYQPDPSEPFTILNAPFQASCGYLDDENYRISGNSPAVAIVAALAGDMLTRPKVRARLFIDNPVLAPEEEKLAALLPVSAKIRDYLDSLAYYHGLSEVRCVWNGLDPQMTDISQYNA